MTCLQYLGKSLRNKPFGFLILYRILFTILFLITSGCDTVGDFFTEEEEILPGKRESVLADRRQLESKFDFVKISLLVFEKDLLVFQKNFLVFEKRLIGIWKETYWY